MKGMARELPVGSSLCYLILLFYLARANEENCCSFPTDCSDMFRGTGISLECHQEVDFPQLDGDCPLVSPSHQENTPGHIELMSIDILYKVRCPVRYRNTASTCKRSFNLNYIGLNITFRITGGSVAGIQFNLQTVDGEVTPIVGTLKRSCHNLNFSDALAADGAGDRLFSYTNYVGLHPGLQYNLTARAFNDASMSHAFFSIPNCRNMKDWENTGYCESNLMSECRDFGKTKDDFFCNIPSPAGFTPMISVQQNLSTEVKLWNGNPPLSSYVLNLKECYNSTSCNSLLQTATLHTTNGQETLHHQFSLNLPAGNYLATVYGQPDSNCDDDQHWGSMWCPEAGYRFQLDKDISHCDNPHFCQLDHTKCTINDHQEAICVCIEGFARSEKNGPCEDINECEITSSLCGTNGHCINTIGDVYCTCSNGYKFNQEKLTCEEAQMLPWPLISLAISATVAIVGITSFTIFVVKRCCYHCDEAYPGLDMRTVTIDSELAQYIPEPLILKPPLQPRGPLESMQGGSEEPLMDVYLRSM